MRAERDGDAVRAGDGNVCQNDGRGALVGGDPVPDSAPPSVEPLDKSADIGFNLSSLATGPLDVYALYGAFDWGLENPQTFIATKEAKESKKAVMADLGFKLTSDMEIDLTFCLDTDDECKVTNHGIFGPRGCFATEHQRSLLQQYALY